MRRSTTCPSLLARVKAAHPLDIMASCGKPSPFQHVDADFKSVFHPFPCALNNGQANAEVHPMPSHDEVEAQVSYVASRQPCTELLTKGQNLALVCSSERVGASYATDPVVVEQVLTGPRCQFRRTQETSVGAAAPTSLRGMPLARVSSCDIDGSHKSKHSCYTDAGLPRKYIASSVLSSSLPPMPCGCDFLLGLRKKTGGSPMEGSTGQGCLLPSCQGRKKSVAWVL